MHGLDMFHGVGLGLCCECGSRYCAVGFRVEDVEGEGRYCVSYYI